MKNQASRKNSTVFVRLNHTWIEKVIITNCLGNEVRGNETHLEGQILTPPDPDAGNCAVIVSPEEAHGCEGVFPHLVQSLIHS